MVQNTIDNKNKKIIKDMPVTAKLITGGIAIAIIPGAFIAYLAFAGLNKAYETLMKDDNRDDKKNNSSDNKKENK